MSPTFLDTNLFQKKTPEGLNDPQSKRITSSLTLADSQNDNNSHIASLGTPADGTNHGRGDELSSRAKMWDPVKDCHLPNGIQTDVPSFSPIRHRSNEQLMNSPLSDVDSMDLHSYHDDGPLNRTPSIRQRFTDSGTGLSRPPSYVMTSEYQGSAFMRTHHWSPSNRLLSGYQETAFVGSQPFEAGHDDRSHHGLLETDSKNGSMSPPPLRGPSVPSRRRMSASKSSPESARPRLPSPSMSPNLTEDDQEEDDVLGKGKPQYSLLEDWVLYTKEKQDLSWQEVAELPIFKGKRKHRSLSQRKHTIGKMRPSPEEAETPWTEHEEQELVALGDAGRSLGEVHRKFPSHNAVCCLKKYFTLRPHLLSGRRESRHSRQTDQGPALQPFKRIASLSVVADHREHRLHSSRLSTEDPDYHSPFVSFDNPTFSRVVSYGSSDSLYPSRRQRPIPSPSTSYTSAANSPTMSEYYTSNLNSPARAGTPLNTHSSSDSLYAAANRFHKPL